VSQEEALTKAKECYIKAIQIDPRESNNMLNPVAPPVGLELVLTGFINQGAVLYTQNNISEAHKMFMESVQLSAMLGKPNEYAMFLAARTARLDSNFVVADQIYSTLIDMNTSNPDVYAEYARMLTNDGEYEKALEVVNKGYEIDEQNREIMLSEADIYLSQKDFVKTKEVLEQILVNDPDNAELNYYIGDMYNEFTKDSTITEEQFLEYLQEANKYYQRALKIKPDFMNAVFNNGIIYFNYGVEVIRQIQELPPSANVEYNRGKQRADSLFRIALPLLEYAFELSPEDMPTIYTLRQIYTRLDMMDKAIEMKKLYDKLAAEIKREEEE
jgi:tetratricopeptide (TPR) repeat protein